MGRGRAGGGGADAAGRRRPRGEAAVALSPAASLRLTADIRGRLTAAGVLTTGAWLAPIAAAVLLAFPSGGYFLSDWGPVSVVLLAILAAVVVSVEVSFGGRWGAVALGAFGGLAAWQGISSIWALQPSAAVNAMNQTVLYVAAFALALAGVRRLTDLTAMTWAALAGSAIVAAYALGGRLLPSLVSGDEQARLSAPISYWNGLGALVAFGALLALGMAGSPRCTSVARAGAAALVPMFLLTLLLTFSRGAVVALLFGLAVLLALAPGRLETVTATIVTVALSAPVLGMANSDPSLAGVEGALAPHEGAGGRLLLVLLATMAVTAVAAVASGALLARLPQRRRRSSGVAVAASALVTVVAVIAVNMPSAGPVGWTEAQLDSFRTFDIAARSDAVSVSSRLAVAAGSGRWQNWGVAADQFSDAPVAGTGAGDYRFFWEQERPIDLTVVNAHSLYLEILGESGLVGLLLLMTSLGVTCAVAGRAILRGPDAAAARPIGVALAAAALIGLHAAGDWDWQLPAVMLPAVALAAGALKVGTGAARLASIATRAAVAVAAAAGILLVIGPTMSAATVESARSAAAAGDLRQALALAREAARESPQDPLPRVVEGNVLADLGRERASDRAFAAAVARSPHDSAIFRDWALTLRDRGDLREARTAAEVAARLNPRDARIADILERLPPAS